MFPENRNFPNRQRKPVKSTGEMQESFQQGSVLPLAILVIIAVVILASVAITALTGRTEDPPEPSESLVTTAPTETTAPTQEPVDTTAPVLAPGEINWNLHGIWITPFGRTGTETELSVSGKVTLGEDGEDTLELSIVFDEAFDYVYTNPKTYTSQSRKNADLPYCVGMGYSYAKWQNDNKFSYFALCPEKEYMIFRWDETPDRYLVASTNPDADPQEILDYFQGFIDFYIKK